MVLGAGGRLRLGNRGGVVVVSTAGVHIEDGSLRLEPGVMTSSSSVPPKALHSLLKEKPFLKLAPRIARHFTATTQLCLFSPEQLTCLLKYDPYIHSPPTVTLT